MTAAPTPTPPPTAGDAAGAPPAAPATPTPTPQPASPAAPAAASRTAAPVARTIAPDFQPDALEIELREPPRSVRLTLFLLIGVLLAGLGWSAVARIDRIVVAPGRVVTTQPTVVVQPLETSVIRAIEVAPGDRVRAGQILATLDPTFTAADVGQTRAEVNALAAQIARMEAEMDGQAYRPSAEPSAEELLQQRIHRQRLAEYTARLAVYDEAIGRLTAGIAARQRDRGVLAERVRVVQEIEDIRNTLFRSQQGSRLTFLEAQDARLLVQRDLGAIDREINDLGHELASQRAERAGYLSEWIKTLGGELAEARRRHEGAANQLDKALRRNAMVTLASPADAVVLEVAKRSVGSVVKEAEPLITLVPLDVPLEAEVEIDARDISHVVAGAAVRLKLDAYPFQRHGMLDGSVRTVSEDAFTPEDGRRPPHYRARVILLTQRLSAVPESFRLLPGLTVTAEILAGDRTALSYVLYPLLKGLDESFREP